MAKENQSGFNQQNKARQDSRRAADAVRQRDSAERKKLQEEVKGLRGDLSRASGNRSKELSNEINDSQLDIVALNRQTAETIRVVELEKRNKLREIGSAYVPDFEGTVEGQFQYLSSQGIYVVKYRNKTYKTIGLGDTSIKKGTPVQMHFSSNSYYSDW